jgi:hypothetical protein
MSQTALQIITEGLRLFGIIDQTENPGTDDIANGVSTLNDLLRNEQADGAAQYLMRRTNATLPAGVSGTVYTFSIGTADDSYAVQVDAVGMKALWCNDINLTVNRETRQAPIADVVRTTYPGIITKWHQERQADGSVLVTAWQPPRVPVPVMIEYGGRVPELTATDGSDVVTMPPEGLADIKLLFGRRVCTAYGRSVNDIALVAQDAERVNKRWRDWARGQQWLRFVRS